MLVEIAQGNVVPGRWIQRESGASPGSHAGVGQQKVPPSIRVSPELWIGPPDHSPVGDQKEVGFQIPEEN